MSQYLEEAAALLRAAAKENETYNVRYPDTARVNRERERISRGFALLAAIENGILPAEAMKDLLVPPAITREQLRRQMNGDVS
jgi:hypothetical protein